MSENTKDNVRKFPRENSMTNGTEAHTLLHSIGGDIRPVKAAIWHVYRLLSGEIPISVSRVKDLWYCDPRVVIRADEMDALRRVAAEVTQKRKEARRALKSLGDAYLGAAERLRQIDPDFYRSEIFRLERQASNLGTLDRAGASLVGNGPSPKGEDTLG